MERRKTIMTTLKASGNTQIQKLAGAIAGNIRTEGKVNISLVGASALNQALKACIVARRFLKDDPNKCDLYIQPEFVLQNFSDKGDETREVTTITLHVLKAEYNEETAVSSIVPPHAE